MESVCRGLSGRDVAKGVKGHGRPLYAAPRSVDAANEPAMERSAMQGRMPGALSFACFSLRKSNVAKRSNSRRLARRANEVSQEK